MGLSLCVPGRVLALAVVLACAVTVRAGESADLSVRPEGPWQVAELQPDGCRAQLALDSDGQARLRDGCAGSAAESAARLGRLLEALAGAGPRVPALRSLDAGRLVELSPELSRRLARAALADPEWQRRVATRASGAEGWANGWVAAALGGGLLREHAAVLAAHGLRVRAVSVEKVLASRPGEAPVLAPLAAEGAGAGQPLPWDAIVWLRLDCAPAGGQA